MNEVHHTTERFFFEDIGGKKLEVDFDGGEVSSDAGVLFLREVERRMKLLDRVAKVLHDHRHPSYTRHSLLDMLKQRVFQIACGYEDADTLRRDPALKMACERLPDDARLASQPTLSRLENALSRTELYRIAEVLAEAFIESYRTPPVAIVLDIDDTEDVTHGHQQLALFNAFFDEYCYLPIHIYKGKSGKLVTTVLRPGKRPSAEEIVAILKRVVRKIRNAWPGVGILLRADSHYTAPEVIEFCETEDLKYALGLTPNAVLRKKAAALVEDAERRSKRERQPVRLFLHSMAYILLHTLRRRHLHGTTWARAQFDTIRLEVLKIGARVRQLRTRIKVHLPTSYPWQADWTKIWTSCRGSP